jgi:uncharacterized LabA/DUF88 family protein
MKTSVYIDAFNLYYGAVKGTPYKWLNVAELCRLALKPYHRFHRFRYFTANVSPRLGDPGQPTRQQTYLRALRTIPNLTIHLGHFLTHVVSMPIAGTDPARYVNVLKTEEKGSDVNLATHLINDAHQKDFECAVLVSNDSDLVEAVKIVKRDLGKPVLVLNPHKERPSVELRRHATFFKTIRKHLLARSQFPSKMQDTTGTFHKPSQW